MTENIRSRPARTGLKAHSHHFSAREVYAALGVDYSIEPEVDA